jgi:hypothetical protein
MIDIKKFLSSTQQSQAQRQQLLPNTIASRKVCKTERGKLNTTEVQTNNREGNSSVAVTPIA